MNWYRLRPSIVACGLDPDEVAQPVSKEKSRELFSAYAGQMRGPKRWVDLWSAGHTVSAVGDVCTVQALVDRIDDEYRRARAALAANTSGVDA